MAELLRFVAAARLGRLCSSQKAAEIVERIVLTSAVERSAAPVSASVLIAASIEAAGRSIGDITSPPAGCNAVRKASRVAGMLLSMAARYNLIASLEATGEAQTSLRDEPISITMWKILDLFSHTGRLAGWMHG